MVDNLGIGDIQSQIWNYFSGKGLDPQTIAAIMGNVGGESAFNPWIQRKGGSDWGLFQWTGPRKAQLFALYGDHPTVQQQLDFAWQEPEMQEALKRMQAAPDLQGKTMGFVGGFEKPKWYLQGQQGNMKDRMAYANDAYAKYGGGAQQPYQVAGTTAPAGTLAPNSPEAAANANKVVNATSPVPKTGKGAGGAGGLLSKVGSALSSFSPSGQEGQVAPGSAQAVYQGGPGQGTKSPTTYTPPVVNRPQQGTGFAVPAQLTAQAQSLTPEQQALLEQLKQLGIG